jgi:hypothetical protein
MKFSLSRFSGATIHCGFSNRKLLIPFSRKNQNVYFYENVYDRIFYIFSRQFIVTLTIQSNNIFYVKKHTFEPFLTKDHSLIKNNIYYKIFLISGYIFKASPFGVPRFS